ncbi:MAG TPA: TetR/AcrR family transcriptional regulator [Thermodesulfobacteriota bacterium]|nr:TetR/AcrR family transcriptional regulator [Thermodesulfobacteriota bacterium]
MPRTTPPIAKSKRKRVSRRETKKRELREAIYETAMALFLQKGFDNVTVEDITHQIEIAKGTFFNYFPNKESILLYFMRRHLEEVKDQIPRVIKEAKTTQQKLHCLFSILAKMVVTNEPLVKWVLLESLRLRVYKKEKKEVSRKILQSVVEIIREGQESGEIKKNMNPEKIAKIMESIFFFSAIRWLTFDRHTPLIDDIQEQIHYFFQGIEA